MFPLSHKYIFFGLLAVQLAIAPPLLDALKDAFADQQPVQSLSNTCRHASVAILGAGMAGITAAQSLSNASVTDFIIVDVNPYIGGRVKSAKFGKDSNGNPYTVELGANWVQGLGTPNGAENPIWALAQKHNLATAYSNLSSLLTYDQNGKNDYTNVLKEYDSAYSLVEKEAGSILSNGYQDRSFRVGLSLAGWKPKKSMLHQAAEFWRFDWEYTHSPDLTSQTFAVVNYNKSFHRFSNANNYVFDSRGFNTIIQDEAYGFLKRNDDRLLLDTNVTDIDYSSADSVMITMSDGSCIAASYAICTFSLGVLQNNVVKFKPSFPQWKQEGIEGMQMGTFTKIFLQFPPDKQFWDSNTQFFLYADPVERGRYPVLQSASLPGFLENSGILVLMIVQAQSHRVELQPDEITQAEVMTVLRNMFGDDIPDPIDFMYPRWNQEPWSHGSYSNWPPGLTVETHQNLRANLGSLYFAGEATSLEYFAFLQGAYFEGKYSGTKLAKCIKSGRTHCEDEVHYDFIKGCSKGPANLSPENGWGIPDL